ncbi:MAG: VWA domain-containing protein [Proteobacteria bacterium]|nr:VWA domain-containing protein [Pseudomonadota bacterium]
MHTRTLMRAGLGLCALTLAACAQTAQTTNTEVSARDEAARTDGLTPPPPPPPVSSPMPMTEQGAARLSGSIGRGVPYAQYAPQPMPGTVDRDQYDHQTDNPIHQVSADPISTFSIDVDSASYSNVRRFLNENRLPPRDAVRVEELINYFHYDYPLPQSRQQPFSTTVAVTPSPWAQGRQLVHIGLQGYNIVPRERPPLNLVLLLDVSGSMSPGDRLPLLIQAFHGMVSQLTARDKVSIVVYAGAAGSVLDPTSGAEHARIDAALDNLHAGGSTAGGEGLRLAYTLAQRNFSPNAVNRVILATDGDFNVGINDPQQLQDFIAHERETGIYLSVFGVGHGNYNDALMQRLAQNGNGVASYIDTMNEARRVLHDELASNLFTIANDVKIQVEFNPQRVAEYRLIGYETRMLNREDFNNDRVDAGEIGSGASVTAIYEIVPVGGRTFDDPLRYQSEGARPAPSTARELAFLRIRYKLPGQSSSRLIERPITDADAYASIDRAPETTRWATAVAAYGQLLRGESYLDRSYSWNDVVRLAQSARGEDDYGWRSEFLQLARTAATLGPLPVAENAEGK